MKNEQKCKPFLKWAGGKGQLIEEIEKFYPFNDKINKYAEPFIGGGAVLFDILNKYDLKNIYISDINKELLNCYTVIKENVALLITLLKRMEIEFLDKIEDERKIYYYSKTCFNGLYRVNKKGDFNVPMGNYKMPKICDEENLINISQKLKNVNIVYGDYKNSYNFIDENTFVYFDPPYRPLNKTASFTSYTEFSFEDREQKELSEYFELLNKKNAKLLLSNSDPKNENIDDDFFDELYKNFIIKRVKSQRAINSKGTNRGKITEILVSNIKIKE